MFTDYVRGQESLCGVRVPGFGAFAFEQVEDAAIERGVAEGLFAALAHEDGDGDAPDTLAGDAPVGTGGDHIGDALFAPGWIPFDRFDFVEGALAECGRRAIGTL